MHVTRPHFINVQANNVGTEYCQRSMISCILWRHISTVMMLLYKLGGKLCKLGHLYGTPQLSYVVICHVIMSKLHLNLSNVCVIMCTCHVSMSNLHVIMSNLHASMSHLHVIMCN